MEEKIYRIINDNLVCFRYYNYGKDFDLEKYISECIMTGNNCEIEIENCSEYYDDHDEDCWSYSGSDYEYERQLEVKRQAKMRKNRRMRKWIEQCINGNFKTQNLGNNNSDDDFDDYERDTFYALSDGSEDIYSGDEYDPDDDAIQYYY
ncbi:hypothetical protein [uncultured Dysgonomonas sp.]|uniref:hypothetical protein n=1 Tax=uncultured Dysgonomonas sp. TaxID=206096 RepID=UPI002804AB09|nr:hypothetical protein [uncultured Dysgonomonas sp.]